VTSAPFEPGLWVSALPFLLVAATFTWLVTLPLRNVSLADSLWSLLLFAAAVIYALDSDPRAPRLSLVLWLLAAWAARLAIYLAARNAGRGESWRHRALRDRHGRGFALRSLLLVFVPQALLAWVVSLPLLGAFASIEPFGLLDGLGAALWLAGFLVEAESDWQLARFRANPANEGAVLRTGPWRFTRHPNYFGECCVWWGFWLIAVSAGAWWTLPGPLLLTWLLWRASRGLEAHLGKGRPQYADYVLKTNAFFPSRPRK
jgi:steroid 5-alpha reductase family enzyme